jgi:putative transcriptional regulator
MKIKLDPAKPQTWPKGRINAAPLDTTTESQLAVQQASDNASAMQDAAKYARRVRQRWG